MAWYEKSFGDDYLELYSHRDVNEARANLKALVALTSPPKDEPLLDLCCGAGRCLLVLRELGFTKVVGLDLSPQLLRVSKKLLHDAGVTEVEIYEAGSEKLPKPAPDAVPLLHADMRSIPYEGYFATIISIFTSFGYFDSDEENRKVLLAIYKALRPGGVMVMDYLNRDKVISSLVPRDEWQLPGRLVCSVRRITDDGRRVEKETSVLADDGSKKKFFESVRMYSEPEMRSMLQEAGFTGIRSYGSVHGDAFGPNSERLVLVAAKGTANA